MVWTIDLMDFYSKKYMENLSRFEFLLPFPCGLWWICDLKLLSDKIVNTLIAFQWNCLIAINQPQPTCKMFWNQLGPFLWNLVLALWVLLCLLETCHTSPKGVDREKQEEQAIWVSGALQYLLQSFIIVAKLDHLNRLQMLTSLWKKAGQETAVHWLILDFHPCSLPQPP